MAKTIKCKSCKSINDKYAKKCSFCGAVLYPEISRKNAELITIILDIIFSFIYLFAIFLFIKNANNNQTPKYINILPAANSFPYFLIINPIINKMPDIIEDYLKLPFDNLMNKYN